MKLNRFDCFADIMAAAAGAEEASDSAHAASVKAEAEDAPEDTTEAAAERKRKRPDLEAPTAIEEEKKEGKEEEPLEKKFHM